MFPFLLKRNPLSFKVHAPQIFQIDHVDAVYERPDHRIVFFVGANMFVLNGNALLDSGPIPLTRIGLPDSVEKVDGAFRWGWNGKTYLFSGASRSHSIRYLAFLKVLGTYGENGAMKKS